METARYDIIGDVHGCFAELTELLAALGYTHGADGLPRHADGFVPVFVGDLTDRGEGSVGVLSLVTRLVASGSALFAPGNHDDKLFRYLRGNKVKLTHGLDGTAAQLNALPDGERETLVAGVLAHLAPAASRLSGLRPENATSHLILDDGKLIIAHAGIRAEWIGVHHGAARAHTLYGDVRGFEPGSGKPIRYDWAAEYDGEAFIAYGHTPAPILRWETAPDGRRYVAIPQRNRTINLDTGCVFGGALTALRYTGGDNEDVPTRALYSVPAHRAYASHEDLAYSAPG